MYSENFYNAVIGCAEVSDDIFRYLQSPLNKHTCFDINYETSTITYLLVDKYNKFVNTDGFDPYNNSLRVSIKPGKFITKVYAALNMNYVAYETVLFTDHINILCIIDKPTENSIKFFHGEDIRKAYLWKSHAKRGLGTLGKSCMRYTKTQSHLDLYVDNINIVKLAALVDPNDKVLARCLIWNNKYHDRVYYATDLSRLQMRGFLMAGKYIDIYANETNIVIQLDHWQYRKYPYMDTMKYLFSSGKLTPDPKFVEPIYTHKTWKQLTSVNGYAY